MNGLEQQIGMSGGALSIDPADSCASERQQFGASRNYFTNQILASTLVGAIGGGLVGGGVAASNNGNVGKGILTGGGVGALTGFAAGYYQTMSEKYQDRQELATRINADLRTESVEIDHSLATFGRLRQCRFAQAAQIKSDLRQDRIDRATARTRLAYQNDRFQEEVSLAKSYGATMARRDGEFQDATTKLNQARPSGTARQATVAATETIPEKRSNFTSTVDKAQTAGMLAFNIDSGEKTSTRDGEIRHA